MVVTNAIRTAGDDFDEAIIKYVRSELDLIIGGGAAERLKIEIGNASPDKDIEKVEIKGTHAGDGLPRRMEIDSEQIREALTVPVSKILDEIKSLLGKTPPELAADIIERGIVMTGGGALLKGLPKLISMETKVPVILAPSPMNCVAIGAGKYFEKARGNDSNNVYNKLNE
jgi:rod shape-determining protein MreB